MSFDISGVSSLDDTLLGGVPTREKSTRKKRPPKSDLNSPRLISLVFKHPALWDDEHEDYKDVNACSAAWDAVAKEMYGTSGAECLKHWRIILKNYQQNLNRHEKYLRSTGLDGTVNNRHKPYKYLKHLSFLKQKKKLEDEIVQGNSCLTKLEKKIFTSSPLSQLKFCDKENGNLPPFSPQKIGSALASFGLSISPLQDVTNSQNSTDTIYKNLTVVDKKPDRKRKKFLGTKLFTIPEEGEKSIHKDDDEDNLKDPSPAKVPKTEDNFTAAQKRQKEIAKKREAQCAAIANRVKVDMAKTQQNIKPLPKPLPKQEEKEREREIIDKLLEEEDRFMYAALSLVQPLRNLPLPKARNVLLQVQQIVFAAEAEVDSQAAVIQNCAQAVKVADTVKNNDTKYHLTADIQALLDAFLMMADDAELPVNREVFNSQVLVMDLKTLRPKTFLNDMIINYYLSMLSVKCNKVLNLSTFFYLDLTQKGYDNAKKWTNKVDIFSYDLLLVPIHVNGTGSLGGHWVMVVVDMKQKSLRFYDSMNGPSIIHLGNVQSFLEKKWWDKTGTNFEADLWSSHVVDVPRQQNSYDCGIFMCKFAECEARRAPIKFTQEDMPTFRRELMYSITVGKII